MHGFAPPSFPLRRRPLAAAALAGPPVTRYKADARSTVWSVYRRGVLCVIKRFQYTPLRQRSGLWMGLHPAQLERRGIARLRRAGLAGVPWVDAGWEPAGLGCKVWLATEWAGRPLHEVLNDPALAQADKHHALEKTAALANALAAAGLWFRDLKPANVLIDPQGQTRLIDVGSLAPARRGDRYDRMIATMQRVLARNGVARNLIDHFNHALQQPRQ